MKTKNYVLAIEEVEVPDSDNSEIYYKITKSTEVDTINFDLFKPKNNTKVLNMKLSSIATPSKGMYYVDDEVADLDVLVVHTKGAYYRCSETSNKNSYYRNSLPITISSIVTDFKSKMYIKIEYTEESEKMYDFTLDSLYVLMNMYSLAENELKNIKQYYKNEIID